MKAHPVIPHFFKPLIPGFKNGLKIPDGFLKYLEGREEQGHAILKKAGKKWVVKLNGQKLEEGWGQFAEEHDLQLGDMLIFRHEGDMEFDVSVFNLSHCDREYAEYLQEEEEAHTVDETSKNFEFKEKLSPNIKLSNKTSSYEDVTDHENEDEGEDEDEDEDAATHDKSFGQSHFECIIRQYCLSSGFMFLPQQFALANGLTTKRCGLIIRDERQRTWNLKLGSYNFRAYIGDGWRKFAADVCLKEGDRIMFEIVTNGETPIWQFRVVSNGETPMRKFQEVATNKSFVQSHFECTITQRYLSKGRLYVPKQLASANGLIDKKCDLIIRDERQRSWNLKFRYWRTQVFIGDGLRKFVVDNCLKKGDRIMFEVVTNGETPTWKFQGIMSHLNAQVSTSTSGDDYHPYFVSTIKPYCINKPVLYFPLDFAKSNGLMDRKCEMILKDETQRCWSVWIGRYSDHFGIIIGWKKFREANGLQVGDAYKFELIKNGKIPIAQFHYSSSDISCGS